MESIESLPCEIIPWIDAFDKWWRYICAEKSINTFLPETNIFKNMRNKYMMNLGWNKVYKLSDFTDEEFDEKLKEYCIKDDRELWFKRYEIFKTFKIQELIRSQYLTVMTEGFDPHYRDCGCILFDIPKPTTSKQSIIGHASTIEQYKRENLHDVEELEQLEKQMNRLKTIIDKRTQLIQIMEQYEELIKE